MTNNYSYWAGQLSQAAAVLASASNHQANSDMLYLLENAALDAKCHAEALIAELKRESEK